MTGELRSGGWATLAGETEATPATRRLEGHVPIVVTGYSGSGKSTISTLAARSNRFLGVGADFAVYRWRCTTRSARPGEVEGTDGYFGLKPEALDRRSANLIYRYRKHGNEYAFLHAPMSATLAAHDMLVIGGEPDTGGELRDAINAARARGELGASLKAIVVAIHRPLQEILRGIAARPAAEAEKQRRIEHVRATWRPPTDHDYVVFNQDGCLRDAVRQLRDVVRFERARQLHELAVAGAG
jgi:guanylate kinase